MKYIKFETKGYVIFEGVIAHNDMAKMIGDIPTSAGFIAMIDGKLRCLGKSETLQLKNDPADTGKIQHRFE